MVSYQSLKISVKLLVSYIKREIDRKMTKANGQMVVTICPFRILPLKGLFIYYQLFYACFIALAKFNQVNSIGKIGHINMGLEFSKRYK